MVTAVLLKLAHLPSPINLSRKMVILCPYPIINIPELDVLTYLFGDGEDLSEEPLWVNAADSNKYLSARTGLQWIKRLAIGLDKLGVKRGEVVMIVTPNTIFVPVAYLGAVGSGRIFTGVNPLYTADGRQIWVSRSQRSHKRFDGICIGNLDLSSSLDQWIELHASDFSLSCTLFNSFALLNSIIQSSYQPYRTSLTLNADLLWTEIAYQMKDTGARVALVHPSLLETARKGAKKAGLPESCLYLFSDKEHKSTDGIKDWRSMLGTPSEASSYTWPHLEGEAAKSQVATVNYSSGTTGLPKGVMITHGNLIANVEQVSFLHQVEQPGIKPDVEDRWIGFLPLYHAYGQLNVCLIAAKVLIPVYIMSAFVYEDFLRTIQTHKITELHVAPPILVLMNKHPLTPKYDISSVTKIGSGAAPLSSSLQNDCKKKFNTNIGQGWGMTELTCAGCSVPGGLRDETGSIGCLLPNAEAKLLDENGAEVATGERGEIYFRGPNVSPGYWKNEKATRETMLEGGWLRTGDIGVTDERRWFWIVDRLKVR